MNNLPRGLNVCDPNQRNFPIAWKEAYFRMHLDKDLGGYVCPGCLSVFRSSKGFAQLRGDHIYPFSRGGLTVWENLQLLCARCNLKKGCEIN